MYKLYVGSNNKTHKLEVGKIVGTVAKYYEGFTYYKSTGYWKGKREKSLIVEISGAKQNEVKKLSKVLCKVLKQEAVAIQKSTELSFVMA